MKNKEVHQIDSNGLYIGPVIIHAKEDEQGNEYWEIPADCIETPPQDGLYQPIKWTGTEWITTLTPEEIEEIKNAPTELSDKERIKALEDTILQLMMERSVK